MKFYGEFYGSGKQRLSELRKEIKGLFKESKSSMTRKSRKLIYNYKLKWKIKGLK